MKALVGNLAKMIRGDRDGRKQLREFIASGSTEPALITLSNGKKYMISTRFLKDKTNRAD